MSDRVSGWGGQGGGAGRGKGGQYIWPVRRCVATDSDVPCYLILLLHFSSGTIATRPSLSSEQRCLNAIARYVLSYDDLCRTGSMMR